MAICNILSANTNHFDACFSHGFLSEVGIVAHIKEVLGFHVRLCPVNAALVHVVTDPQNHKPVTNLLKQVLDEAAFNLHRVDPGAENSLLLRSIDVVVDEASSLKLLLSELLETVLAVEHGSDENRVDLGVALHKIVCANDVVDTHGSRVCNHKAGALQVVAFFEGVERAVGGVELVEHVDALPCICKVSAQVADWLLTGSGEVEVHPADEDFLLLELLEVRKLLTWLEEAVDLRALSESDALHGKEAGELPEDAEHEVGSLIQEGLRVYADDLNHGLGDSERLIEVLSDLVDVEVGTLVDCAHIDGVLLDVVQQVDHDHTVAAAVEKIVTSWIDGKALSDESIFFANTINCARNHTNLFVKVVVMSASFGLNLVSGAHLGHHRLAEVLARRLDRLHHIEELNPVDSAIRILINALEHILHLIVRHISVAHAHNGIFELGSINGAALVRVEALESVEHLSDLIGRVELPVSEGHVVGVGRGCFNHSVWR